MALEASWGETAQLNLNIDRSVDSFALLQLDGPNSTSRPRFADTCAGTFGDAITVSFIGTSSKTICVKCDGTNPGHDQTFNIKTQLTSGSWHPGKRDGVFAFTCKDMPSDTLIATGKKLVPTLYNMDSGCTHIGCGYTVNIYVPVAYFRINTTKTVTITSSFSGSVGYGSGIRIRRASTNATVSNGSSLPADTYTVEAYYQNVPGGANGGGSAHTASVTLTSSQLTGSVTAESCGVYWTQPDSYNSVDGSGCYGWSNCSSMPVVTAPTKTNSLQGSDLSMFSGAVGSPVLSVNNYYNGSIMDAGSSMSVSGTTATRNFVYRCCQNGGTLRADLVTSYGGRGGIAFDRNYTIFNGIGEQTIVCGLPI